MVTTFEEETKDLTQDELVYIAALIAGFNRHTEENPIKAPEIVRNIRNHAPLGSLAAKFSEPKLRKCVNYIRVNGMIPLIATSNGYFVSNKPEVIRKQIFSLEERARSIKTCADGLKKFLR